MIAAKIWLERRKASLCILIALCTVSLCVIFYSEENKKGSAADSFAVTIRHYGINAEEMERSVTIPLEDAVSQIQGVIYLQSSSENNTSKVFVRFSRGGQYDALREAAQRVYESLPQSAQRPEIQSSDSSRIPVWTAAVFSAGGAEDANVEKILKPRLESIDGAGEVHVFGAGLREIVINLDQEKTAALNLPPSSIAAVMAMNDAVFPGGLLTQNGKEIIVTVDGRFGSEEYGGALPLSNISVPLGEGKAIALSEIASIVEQERKPDTFSRINGKKAIVVSVMAGSGVDLRKLSKNINKEITDTSLPFEFTVLSDRGAEEAAAFKSVFEAAMQGALMVAVIGFLLNRRTNGSGPSVNYAGMFCGLSVPGVCLVSAAILCAFGLPPNRAVLAGISAGVGTAVDAIILCSERLRKCKNYDEARLSMRTLYGPLLAGTATTVAALLPIPAMMNGDAGVIAVSIAAVTLCALFFSLGPLPPLLLWNLHATDRPIIKTRGKNRKVICSKLFANITNFFSSVSRRFSGKTGKLLAANVRFCVRHPRLVVTSCLIVTLAGLAALFIKGADTGEYASGNSVYAHVEFEGSLLAQEADYLLASYGELLAAEHGIINVETSARTGSGSVLIAFDPKITNTEKIRNLARQIPLPGAYLFFPETTPGIRHWEIKISGDETKKCREIAEETALTLSASPLVKERVLNFKQGSQKLSLFPDREKIVLLGMTYYALADDIRRAVYGPVVYKRISSGGETDVRVRRGGWPDTELYRNQIMGIPAYANNSGLNIDSLFVKEDDYEISNIRREDRRRTASITIVTKPIDPRRVKKQLQPLLDRVILPIGYSLEFDPTAIRQAEELSGTIVYFLLALLFCYMVLASVNESFGVPLAILFSVPPSLAAPAIFLSVAGFPVNIGTACAFVAVSGMTVNAAVLCAGGISAALSTESTDKRMPVFLALRRNSPALLATTATTIAGAIPFIFLGENENVLVRTMAIVTALGVGGSCLCAVSVMPSLMLLLSKQRKKIPLERKKIV